MEYLKFKPVAELAPYVECFFIWRTDRCATVQYIDTPPSAFPAFVFNLRTPTKVAMDHQAFIDTPLSFISGQCLKNYTLELSAPLLQIGIVFKPTGIHHLYGLSMFEFTNSRIDLQDILGSEMNDLLDQLQSAKDDIIRIHIVENMLLERLIERLPVCDGVDAAASTIIDRYGNVQVSDILVGSCMSRRKFERYFLRKVGISPKFYARIRRYGYICSLIAGKRSVAWDQLLYRVGFYDQSHFIKDFKEFSGVSPNQYLHTNKELAHQLEALDLRVDAKLQ